MKIHYFVLLSSLHLNLWIGGVKMPSFLVHNPVHPLQGAVVRIAFGLKLIVDGVQTQNYVNDFH